MGAVITASAVTKVYGRAPVEVTALRRIDLEVGEGSFTAVMGPSGSGKSSLVHCLAGLDVPTSGEITVAGARLEGLGERGRTDLRRDRLGFVFQQYNLLPELTGRDNVLLPLAIAGRKPDRAWFDRVVDALGIRGHLARRPAELSGGQQQRVAIARALVNRPAVVFADEPTGNLDSVSSAAVMDLLRTCAVDLGQTVVMVTHDAVAATRADRVVLLADGRIAGDLTDHSTQDVLGALERVSTWD